eukprot:COSAG01_NODE_14_length_41020_cov_40.702133_4_plen_190_part_00
MRMLSGINCDLSKYITIQKNPFKFNFNSDAIFLRTKFESFNKIIDYFTDVIFEFKSDFSCDIYVRCSISGILNELFENCVKFSSAKASIISFSFYFSDHVLFIKSQNYTSKTHYLRLFNIYNRLKSSSNSDSFFLSHLQSMDAETEVSNLGLITLYQHTSFELQLFPSKLSDNLYQINSTASVNLSALN